MNLTQTLHLRKLALAALPVFLHTLIGVHPLAADILSVNLTEFNTDLQNIDADETYGVAGLGSVVGGWVNLNQTLTATNVPLSSGAASTIDVALTAPNGWGSGAAGVNDTPMKGFADDYTATVDPTSLTLSDINATFGSGYFAIVYLSGFNLNDGASISDGTSAFYFQPVNFANSTWDGVLVQTTQTTDLGSGNAPIAQYAVFGSGLAPLTADAITFTLDTLYGGGAGIGGVQLVAVPEPAAMALLAGAAALGLIALRRRNARKAA